MHKEDGGSGLLVTGLLLSVNPEAADSSWIENVWRSVNSSNEDAPVPVDLSYVILLLLMSASDANAVFSVSP